MLKLKFEDMVVYGFAGPSAHTLASEAYCANCRWELKLPSEQLQIKRIGEVARLRETCSNCQKSWANIFRRTVAERNVGITADEMVQQALRLLDRQFEQVVERLQLAA